MAATAAQKTAAETYAKSKFSYIYKPTAYIEVYEDGWRRTVSADGYLDFEFESDPVYGVTNDTKDLLIRVTQFAESGHEVISEYTVTVYYTPDPILRDLQTRQVNTALTPTYHPTTREYTTTVYDQEKNFNIWALADYGINYRDGYPDTSALEGAKLTMTAYKTKTADEDALGRLPTDPDWVPTYKYSDPLKITRAYQAKAEMEYDANTKLQVANETIASAAGATTVSTNRDVLDVVYDQTDPQFGEKDSTTNPYVEKFWVEVTVEYEITVDGTTEHRVAQRSGRPACLSAQAGSEQEPRRGRLQPAAAHVPAQGQGRPEHHRHRRRTRDHHQDQRPGSRQLHLYRHTCHHQ